MSSDYFKYGLQKDTFKKRKINFTADLFRHRYSINSNIYHADLQLLNHAIIIYIYIYIYYLLIIAGEKIFFRVNVMWKI